MDGVSTPMRYRPVVAITGPRKGGFSRFFIAMSVFLAGGWPRMVVPGNEQSSIHFDALIISGGDDLNYALFENETCELDDIIDSSRDALEYALLHEAVMERKPVLGICRGYQLINVFFGGSLMKDIRRFGQKVRYSPLAWKPIEINEKSCLAEITGTGRLKINTLHHQAVEEPAPGFEVCAEDNRGIIQSIRYKHSLDIYGVQWHPEYLFYLSSHFKLFVNLIKRADPAI